MPWPASVLGTAQSKLQDAKRLSSILVSSCSRRSTVESGLANRHGDLQVCRVDDTTHRRPYDVGVGRLASLDHEDAIHARAVAHASRRKPQCLRPARTRGLLDGGQRSGFGIHAYIAETLRQHRRPQIAERLALVEVGEVAEGPEINRCHPGRAFDDEVLMANALPWRQLSMRRRNAAERGQDGRTGNFLHELLPGIASSKVSSDLRSGHGR